ncbi:uncharacterized protein TM35_000101720 [Trypanosoma theileri]|uniref:Uncharacterized protein n=1 Tax=Trypanosoma theileri TaxID=67003 RepID=A0A1X0NYX7_9TRYP|nr:uncharacterized protein TM35_000101720 [Trypanosoma theileri]ORC89904.1 hypothetical protein TM35_000101720 [Trypanosoma theileri]
MASVQQSLGGSPSNISTLSQHSKRQRYHHHPQQNHHNQHNQQEQPEPEPGKIYHLHRVPRVDVVEMQIPVVSANFPPTRGEISTKESGLLPTLERGTIPGVSFDDCNLSTVGSASIASTHRRMKKYTTTTITTTTITKIILPHMSQVLPSDGNNRLPPEKILMCIEGQGSGNVPNLNNSDNVGGSQLQNGDGHIYSRNSEQQQQLEWGGETMPASNETPLRANRHQGQNLSNPNNSSTQESSDSPNSHDGGALPSGQLVPRAEPLLPQLQVQQPWVFNHQTVSKTTSVSRQPPSLSSVPRNEKQGTSSNGREVYGDSQNTGTPPHSQYLLNNPAPGGNEKMGENEQQPWILNEEKTQTEWHITD